MKKSTKFGLLGALLITGVTALSGCTASFCSTNDKAHILYMFDYGVSEYHNEASGNNAELVRGFTSLYVSVNRPTDSKSGIGASDSAATNAGLAIPTDKFFVELDTTVLQHAVVAHYNQANDKEIVKFSDVPTTYIENIVSVDAGKETPSGKISVQEVLDEFGYLKFADSETDKNTLWTNFDAYLAETRALIAGENPILTLDDLPSVDYVNIYKNVLNNSIAQLRSCLAIETGEYGYYGYGSTRDKTVIEKKDWGYAWKRGFLEGLLIYPIAWLTETLVSSFKNAGLSTGGWAQLLAILIVTVIVRSLMLIVTINQTAGNTKLQALQPEINKIQSKYPNANTNQYEKQRMAEEMQKLYKKNKINPLSTLVTLIVQFPVFICVWGALQGAASLSTDAVLGLNLSLTIREVLFDSRYWTAAGNFGAVTALVLFILMAGTQVVSMLLPQWIQKSKAKKDTKLGKNPAKTEQDNKMKWFTYIMMAMIIVMGFSLASAMGVYWLVGALFSIAQTFITTSISDRKKLKR